MHACAHVMHKLCIQGTHRNILPATLIHCAQANKPKLKTDAAEVYVVPHVISALMPVPMHVC